MATAIIRCVECDARITISGNNRRDADYRAKKHSGVCRDCENAKKTAAAAELAGKMDLPPLKGTEKQIAWAEVLRVGQINSVSQLIEAAISRRPPAGYGVPIGAYHELVGFLDDPEDGAEAARVLPLVPDKLMSIDDAKFFIDLRDLRGYTEIVQHLAALVREDLAKPELSPEEEDLQAAVLAEAVMRPAEPKSPTIADIKLNGRSLSIVFPEKRNDFRELVKDMDFRWNGDAWCRTLDGFSGEPDHRIVETASILLAAGFVVRVLDSELRDRIVAGDYKPEPLKWIKARTVKDAHEGWFVVSWSRRAGDYYRVARNIRASKWIRQAVVVPPSSADEVLDFAQQYGFEIAPAAAKVVEGYRASLGVATTVSIAARAPDEVEVKLVPDLLAIPETVEVADDLRDDD